MQDIVVIILDTLCKILPETTIERFYLINKQFLGTCKHLINLN